MNWDERKMDNSFLFRRILQPIAGWFMDALNVITDGWVWGKVDE